jgi:hypothetical protein
MGHIPSCFIGSLKLPLKLFSGYSLLGRANHIDSQEPFSEWKVRIVEDSSGSHGVLIAAVNAFIQMAYFVGFAVGVELKHTLAFAADTFRAFRPADAFKVSNAPFFGVESLKYLKNRRLLFHGYLI